VKGIADGTLAESPQTTDTDHSRPSSVVNRLCSNMHPKFFTETCNIDWRRSIDEIHNLIRGLSPFPCAFTELGDKTIKDIRGEKELSLPTSKPGRWESDGKTYLKFAQRWIYSSKRCTTGRKKRMLIEDFLRGYRFG
jgi:Methionyl-tRNA formyltransferase